ncbi:MAG TPA: DUF2723 domain-containing protein, partial [Gemmatimonadaceae bacterium]
MRAQEIKKYLFPSSAVIALALGYADLWRGGTEWASVLLVLGYCALVPAALWTTMRGAPARAPVRAGAAPADAPGRGGAAPYRLAAGFALAVAALYVATLAPSTAMWDTSEYIAVAKVLGLPHPPGNPLFVLLAHVAGMLPVPVSYAARINLLAAVASAAGAGCWLLCAHRLLRDLVPAPLPRLVAATAAALLGATAFTVWNQSVVNEKVYTVSLFGLALGSWLVLRWLDTRDDRLLVMLAYLAGLGYTVHPAGMLVAPPVAVAVLVAAPRTLLRGRLLATLALVLVVGLTPFAFEPIRAGHHPPINEGVPTACTGARPEVGCTFSGATARLLLDNIQRKQYGGNPVLERRSPFGAQLGMWWLYFRWQWLRDLDGSAPLVQSSLAALFLVLGVLGIAAGRRGDRASWWYFAPLMATLTIALVFYLNFRYGWSQAPALGDRVPREPRDRDYFYIWTFSAWGMFAGIGLAHCWRELARALEGRGVPTARAWRRAAPVMALALVPLAVNWRPASRNAHHFTAAWATDLLQSVEPYGVIITNGDNDSFPLWYAQEVEGTRRDVTVALTPYMGLASYTRELLRRAPEPFDAARGHPAYRGATWTRPAGPLWRLTPQELDAIPDYLTLDQPQRFRKGAIEATITAPYLTRDQLLVLRAIQDSFPARPIYFVFGGYANALGLAPYLRQQGLALKLEARPVAGDPGVVDVQGMLLDVARTDALWRSYRAPARLIEEGQWADAASVQIPSAYMITGQELAAALAARG